MKNQAIAEMSAAASILISHISRMKVAEEITWDEINRVVGWDVREKRSIICTVKNRLERDYGIVLGSIPGVGYRLLPDTEKVNGELPKDREARRRSAQRSKRKAGTVELAGLPSADQLRCLSETAIAHVTIVSSSAKSMRQVTQALGGETKPLQLNKALEALKQNL